MAFLAASLLWIVVVGGIASFITAFAIGANDVANTFAAAVGSRALPLWTAIILAAILETVGATLLGATVTEKIKSNVISFDQFSDSAGLLALGMLCALIGAGAWLVMASRMGLPVSTTHSIIGALLGFGLATGKLDGIHWKSVLFIVVSWFVAPVSASIVGGAVFVLIRTFILRTTEPLKRGFWTLPVFVFLVCASFSFFLVFKNPFVLDGIECAQQGPAGKIEVKIPCVISQWASAHAGIAAAISLGLAVCLTVLLSVFLSRLAKKRIRRRFRARAAELREEAKLSGAQVDATWSGSKMCFQDLHFEESKAGVELRGSRSVSSSSIHSFGDEETFTMLNDVKSIGFENGASEEPDNRQDGNVSGRSVQYLHEDPRHASTNPISGGECEGVCSTSENTRNSANGGQHGQDPVDSCDEFTPEAASSKDVPRLVCNVCSHLCPPPVSKNDKTSCEASRAVPAAPYTPRNVVVCPPEELMPRVCNSAATYSAASDAYYVAPASSSPTSSIAPMNCSRSTSMCSLKSFRTSDAYQGNPEGDAFVAADARATDRRGWKSRVKCTAQDKWNNMPWFKDLHAEGHEGDEVVDTLQNRAELFDEKAEILFSCCQILSSCLGCLAHSANDTANAIGPFAAILTIYKHGPKENIRVDWYVLMCGGLAMSLGLALMGYRVIRTMGVKLVKITPARGFSIELGAAWVVLIFSSFGIPLSTTHCAVGSTLGVGLMEPKRERMGFVEGLKRRPPVLPVINTSSVNWRLFGSVFVSWIGTVVFSCLVSMAVFSFAAYSPSIYSESP